MLPSPPWGPAMREPTVTTREEVWVIQRLWPARGWTDTLAHEPFTDEDIAQAVYRSFEGSQMRTRVWSTASPRSPKPSTRSPRDELR